MTGVPAGMPVAAAAAAQTSPSLDPLRTTSGSRPAGTSSVGPRLALGVIAGLQRVARVRRHVPPDERARDDVGLLGKPRAARGRATRRSIQRSLAPRAHRRAAARPRASSYMTPGRQRLAVRGRRAATVPDVAHTATPRTRSGATSAQRRAARRGDAPATTRAGPARGAGPSRTLRSATAPRPTTSPSAATTIARTLCVPTSRPTHTGGGSICVRRCGRRRTPPPRTAGHPRHATAQDSLQVQAFEIGFRRPLLASPARRRGGGGSMLPSIAERDRR